MLEQVQSHHQIAINTAHAAAFLAEISIPDGQGMLRIIPKKIIPRINPIFFVIPCLPLYSKI